MTSPSSQTERVVRNHLQAFLEQQGPDAITRDYSDDATFVSETRTYRGRHEIRGFFEQFVASLPAAAVQAFALRSLHVESEIAYITWSAGPEVPLGTDTFVVRNGRIVWQTFAMHRTSSG